MSDASLPREKLMQPFLVPPNKRISLAKDYDPAEVAGIGSKRDAGAALKAGIAQLAELQNKLYAQDTYALLIVLQALDAAGKDGVIKHVFTGINPQGCDVHSFKAPSAEELNHDYLWRCAKVLPERGRIGIFNRSYYEEVLIAHVHPEILAAQHLPSVALEGDVWKRRYDQINQFERYLSQNGIVVLKFFLHISKQEQKRRFLDRIEQADKNWKFSAADVRERERWTDYQHAYEDVFNHTSTAWAPWYVIPADHKWFTRVAVAAIIVHQLEDLNLEYPTLGDEQRQSLKEARDLLEHEH